MVIMKDIHKSYENGKISTKALRGIDLSVRQGEFLSIVGPSGCGKTTLLNIIGCMDRLYTGTYSFQGQDMCAMSMRQLAKFRNMKLGFIFQSFHLVNELSVLDNVAMPLGYAGLSKKERNMIAMNQIERVGLHDCAKKRPTQISGGQRQRVAIARALVNRPQLILADEPTGNLDQENGEAIFELLRDINITGTTLMMVTHNLELANRTERIIQMMDGMIVKSVKSGYNTNG